MLQLNQFNFSFLTTTTTTTITITARFVVDTQTKRHVQFIRLADTSSLEINRFSNRKHDGFTRTDHDESSIESTRFDSINISTVQLSTTLRDCIIENNGYECFRRRRP